jgi:hypothetical protein
VKERHISRHIRKKVDEWLESIEDEAVRKLAADNSIVTGGAIVSLLTGEKVNDYDVYFKTLEVAEAVAQYYVGKFNEVPANSVSFSSHPSHIGEADVYIKEYQDEARPKCVMIRVKSAGVVAAEQEGKAEYAFFEGQEEGAAEDYMAAVTELPEDDDELYKPVFLTSNAITLTGDIQLVFRFYGTPAEIHKNFDFQHCTNYWSSWKYGPKALYLRRASLIAIMNRELIYLGNSLYPLSALFRLRKFMKRGWYYSLGTMLKIVFDVNKLDLSEPGTLQEQLVGMDIAYFIEVIQKIKDDKVTNIDATYLHQVIDELY